MRITTFAGIVLVVAGAFVLLRGASITSGRDLPNVGALTVPATGQHQTRQWVAGLVFIGGLILVVRGVNRKPLGLRR